MEAGRSGEASAIGLLMKLPYLFFFWWMDGSPCVCESRVALLPRSHFLSRGGAGEVRLMGSIVASGCSRRLRR